MRHAQLVGRSHALCHSTPSYNSNPPPTFRTTTTDCALASLARRRDSRPFTFQLTRATVAAAVRMNTDRAEGGGSAAAAGERRYRGVRKRKWGRWVSEIRLPNSRERIWLGSYDSPEKAARAFDAAVVCLRGRRGRLNFPDTPPRIAGGRSLGPRQIQAAAARHAHNDESPAAVAAPEMSPSEAVTAESGQALDLSLMDLMTAPYGIEMDFSAATMDDFAYDFFSPAPETTDVAEETGGVGFGSNSSLWSF